MRDLTVTDWFDFMCINRSALARKLGVVRQTITYWEQTNKIPAKYRDQIKNRWVGKAPDSLFESEDE